MSSLEESSSAKRLRIAAAPGLPEYCLAVLAQLSEEKLQEKLEASDKQKIATAVQEALDWCHEKELAEKAKLKELEGIVESILRRCAPAVAIRETEKPAEDIADNSYPTFPVTTGGGRSSSDPGGLSLLEPDFRKCLGCRWRLPKGDARHTRVLGECKHPHDTSDSWTCPGCVSHRPRGYSDHTNLPTECRWATAGHRQNNLLAGVRRDGGVR